MVKTIPPAWRERKRYILFQIFSTKKIEKEEVLRLVTQAGLRFLGELGMAKAGIQFLPETFIERNQTGILRTGHKYVDETKSALALVKDSNGKKISVACLKVSGSIKKLKDIYSGFSRNTCGHCPASCIKPVR